MKKEREPIPQQLNTSKSKKYQGDLMAAKKKTKKPTKKAAKKVKKVIKSKHACEFC